MEDKHTPYYYVDKQEGDRYCLMDGNDMSKSGAYRMLEEIKRVQENKKLTEQVENLKEKVLTLDRVLKENHDQAQQQWEQDQAKISRLREEKKEQNLLIKYRHERLVSEATKRGSIGFKTEDEINFLQSLLSKFPEVPNE